MSVVDSNHQVFPISPASNSHATTSSPTSSSSSSTQLPNSSRRRIRTREISTNSPSPPWPNQEISKTEEQIGLQKSVIDSSVNTTSVPRVDTDGDQAIYTSPIRSQGHSRSTSATLSVDVHSPNNSLNRSDSVSSHTTGAHTLHRRSLIPTSPPNAWLQRVTNSKIDGKGASAMQSPSKQSRNRSGSLNSFGGSDLNSHCQEDQASVPVTPRGLSGFRRSMSRKSVHIIHADEASGLESAESNAILRSQQAHDESFLETITPKEKKKLFGKREEKTTINTDGKGMIRRVSSRSFFGGNKDKNKDANASSETLSSVSTTGTAKTELARKAGDALSKTTTLSPWTRRSKKNAASMGTEEASINGKDAVGSSFTTEEEEFSDLTPRGEDCPESTSVTNNHHASASNGTNSQERGEGLPKRFSGWLTNILSSSGINVEDRNGRISTSDSSSTVRRKSSALSLSRSEGNDRLTPSQFQGENSSNTGGQSSSSSSSRPRNSGLLSNLSAPGRARAETTSSSNGSGSRSGLDRALRYFMDSGDSQQNQDEGIWLLGVWHGPKQPSQETLSAHQPTIEVTNPSPRVRESRSLTQEGDNSSVSRRGSDIDLDDDSTEESSKRTRETSPSIASVSTGGSLSRSSKTRSAAERSLTPENDIVVTRNPPTPQTSRTINSFATSTGSASTVSNLNRQQERSSISSNSYIASFQTDFSSRIWCTYRSHFVPISRDGAISHEAETAAAVQASLQADAQEAADSSVATLTGRGLSSTISDTDDASATAHSIQSAASPTSSQGTLGSALGLQSSQNGTVTSSLGDKMGIPNLWSRATAAAQAYGLGGRAGLTTDAGWGCMLRTGQSVLANALLNVHLGRDWRRTPRPVGGNGVDAEAMESDSAIQKQKKEYAKYVELLTWFMDEPSLGCPFGVHRMAREGKRLGKEVGEWFGPSTAAGAIKKLVDDYPEAGLGVSLASDGVIYLDQVRTQAHIPMNGKQRSINQWSRPVLVLIGVRLGLDGVHPMYHDSIKATFSFPQSVGIAGGRPSSSYYFMGYQGNSLFYLDPHHVRSSIPFRHPPPNQLDETSWWLQAYSEVELSTFHNDRPRRMPMKSLDPSMLLGFLINDEESLSDFVNRVKSLPRPIFSVLDSMPKWMMDDEESTLLEDDKALESFSESSFDDGLASEKDAGALETLRGRNDSAGEEEEDSVPDDAEARIQRNSKLNQITLSNITTTPRSESTFEFVDRQALPSPRHIAGKEKQIRHPVTHETAAEGDVLHEIDSDGGSAWEEVGVDSLQRR